MERRQAVGSILQGTHCHHMNSGSETLFGEGIIKD